MQERERKRRMVGWCGSEELSSAASLEDGYCVGEDAWVSTLMVH